MLIFLMLLFLRSHLMLIFLMMIFPRSHLMLIFLKRTLCLRLTGQKFSGLGANGVSTSRDRQSTIGLIYNRTRSKRTRQ